MNKVLFTKNPKPSLYRKTNYIVLNSNCWRKTLSKELIHTTYIKNNDLENSP